MSSFRQQLDRLVGNQTMAVAILVSFLVILVPLGIGVGIYAVDNTSDSLKDSTKANLTTLASQVSSEVERALYRSYQDIQVLADNPIISSVDASVEEKLTEMNKAQRSYERIQEYYDVFFNITLIDLEGNEIAYTDEPSLEDWTEKRWFQDATKGFVTVSPPHRTSEAYHEMVMAYGAPVKNDNQVIAVIVGQMNMNTLWQITDNAILGETGITRIIDENGNIFAHPDRSKLLGYFEHFDFTLLTNPDDVRLLTYDEDGTRTVASYAAVEDGPNWYVVVSQSHSEAFDLLWDTTREVLIGVGIGLVLLFIVVAVLLHRLTRPLHALTVGAEKIGSGDLTFRVPVSGSVETRRLASSFNEMAGNLENAERLRAEHGLLRKLQAASLALASSLSPEEVIRIISNGIQDILACDVVWVLLADDDMKYLESRSFVSSSPWMYEDEDGIIWDVYDQRIPLSEHGGLTAKTAQNGNPLFLDEASYLKDMAESDSIVNSLVKQNDMANLNLIPLRLPDRSTGIIIFGKTLGIPLSDEEKRVLLVFAHQATISLERARLHEHELRNTEELTRLNDLKSRLLHILSHELKTPLTSLKTSARLLHESDTGEMEPETRDRLIGSILRATERLSGVADDIYPVAGVLTNTIKIEPRDTDCRRLVELAVEVTSVLTGNKGQSVSISVSPSITRIRADKERLKQVIAELITNASKFSPNESRIDVRVHDEPNQVVFSVVDTGVGISSEDQKSVFDGFYQADSEVVRRAGGRGLGLLFAKSVVESHGGKIWLESALGQGSSFYFTIPKE